MTKSLKCLMFILVDQSLSVTISSVCKEKRLPDGHLISKILHGLPPHPTRLLSTATLDGMTPTHKPSWNPFADHSSLKNLTAIGPIGTTRRNHEKETRTVTDASRLKCEHYGRPGHNKDKCWDIFPELKKSPTHSVFQIFDSQENNVV